MTTIGAGHINRVQNPEIVLRSQRVFMAISGALYAAAAITLVVLILVGFKNCCVGVFNKGKTVVSKINTNLPSAPGVLPSRKTSAATSTEREWKTFKIPNEGLSIYLNSGWQDEAIGGDITITTPDGIVLHDKPGANYNFGPQREGLYIFRADPPGAMRQVQIKGSS